MVGIGDAVVKGNPLGGEGVSVGREGWVTKAGRQPLRKNITINQVQEITGRYDLLIMITIGCS
jgi:hypothetical protein